MVNELDLSSKPAKLYELYLKER